jgi:hypothetical protein
VLSSAGTIQETFSRVNQYKGQGKLEEKVVMSFAQSRVGHVFRATAVVAIVLDSSIDGVAASLIAYTATVTFGYYDGPPTELALRLWPLDVFHH